MSRSSIGWLLRSVAARALLASLGFTISVLPATRSAGAENGFELKTSGYFNLTPGGVLHGARGQTGSSVKSWQSRRARAQPEWPISQAGSKNRISVPTRIADESMAAGPTSMHRAPNIARLYVRSAPENLRPGRGPSDEHPPMISAASRLSN